MKRVYLSIEVIVQRAPFDCDKWYAGIGYHAHDGELQIAGGCYLQSEHPTIQDAKRAALESAASYRNTVLTLGGCTRETLPPITFHLVGQSLSDEYDF